jgi:hypothetical protein
MSYQTRKTSFADTSSKDKTNEMSTILLEDKQLQTTGYHDAFLMIVVDNRINDYSISRTYASNSQRVGGIERRRVPTDR